MYKLCLVNNKIKESINETEFWKTEKMLSYIIDLKISSDTMSNVEALFGRQESKGKCKRERIVENRKDAL